LATFGGGKPLEDPIHLNQRVGTWLDKTVPGHGNHRWRITISLLPRINGVRGMPCYPNWRRQPKIPSNFEAEE